MFNTFQLVKGKHPYTYITKARVLCEFDCGYYGVVVLEHTKDIELNRTYHIHEKYLEVKESGCK